ncbi:MAG: sulfotransferase domain-containing protein [Flavobacteriaceae bacterium]|nr:sulfotransferase domain-containing protein [Flavobacteriaceae bacterium]
MAFFQKYKIFIQNIFYVWIYPRVTYKKVIWLLGAGRSGSTWISSLINYDNSYRELFEPFHINVGLVKKTGFRFHQYKLNFCLKIVAKWILKGKLLHPWWVEKTIHKTSIKNHSNDFLLIKDIYANLFAYEICSKNEKIKPILLIKNPFAVAVSRKKTGWENWDNELDDLLQQKELYDDYLRPFEDIISDVRKNGSYYDRQILVWCIINYIPLKQFSGKNILVTFYEDWLTNPHRELYKCYKYLILGGGGNRYSKNREIYYSFKSFNKYQI